MSARGEHQGLEPARGFQGSARLAAGSLTVVGTGISLGVHITPEARVSIERADTILYLMAEPAAAAWVQSLNEAARSLESLYEIGKNRGQIYEAIVEEILSCVRAGQDVCAVFYGHPGVFVNPGHEAVRRAREEGFAARMLPAISAEDCLFADLGVDPGALGCQSYEATDFLLFGYSFDTRAPLVLWQVGVIGERQATAKPSHEGLAILAEGLLETYGPAHEVVLYLASPYPIADPVIRPMLLRDLAGAELTGMETLYVPPSAPVKPDPGMLERLGMAPPT